MNRRATATIVVAAATAAALCLSACGSGKKGGVPGNSKSVGSDSPVTLKFVGADYGTTQATRPGSTGSTSPTQFHKKNPKITVKVTTINWTDYDTKVKTQLQDKNYPDILRG